MRAQLLQDRTTRRGTRRAVVARVVTAGALLLVSAWFAGVVSPVGAEGATRGSTCSTVSIAHFAFKPSSVARGQSSSAVLTAHNCTGAHQDATVTWVGRFAGPAGGLPPGCPVIDPIALPIHLAPHHSVRASVSLLVLSSCTATSLGVTDTVANGGLAVARATATLTVHS